MSIKRSRSKRGDQTYKSVLLVQGERVPVPRGHGRPRKDDQPKTKVGHRALAKLSQLSEALVALVDRFCEVERAGEPLDGFVSVDEPVIGSALGTLAALLMLARELGIERALGSGRQATLFLVLRAWLIVARGCRRCAGPWPTRCGRCLARALRRG
ncbi:MAG: hypothetical protein JXX28_01680 [Deltaproteobacteria bacterium]|nr:hypothetical protein [Deltaproteobacteria bacterium]